MPITTHEVLALLKVCEKKKDTTACRHLHYLMTRLGYDSTPFLSDHLIRLFGSYGSLLEANLVFSVASRPNVFTWQAIMSAHCSHGKCDITLHLYYKMLENGIHADRVAYLCALKACGLLEDESQAYMLHKHIIETEHDVDVKVSNTIVDTYAKCNRLEDAATIFSKLQQKSVVSWTAIIATYAEHGYNAIALEHFEQMTQSGVNPDGHAFAAALKACSNPMETCQGRKMHHQIALHGLEGTLVIGSALVDMYATCRSLAEAQIVFEKLPTRNVVTWNAMITGYCRHGELLCARELFERMEREGVKPNAASWNAMISGYTQESLGLLAIELYERMRSQGVKPDVVTFLCILKACASVGALAHGKSVHEDVQQCGLDSTLAVGNTLIDMYCKCSSLYEALTVLDTLPRRDVVSWGAIIGGLTQHGYYDLALECFQEMQEEGIQPTYDTYTSVLTSCRFLNFPDEGHYYFKSMSEKHGIKQGTEHFNCMVDLLGRAGRLQEAVEMLDMIPSLSNLHGWMSLLTASKKFGNTDLGYTCFDQALRIDPSIGSGYVLMARAYGDEDKWDDVQKVQRLKIVANAVKKPGRSWIEVASKVHEFCVSDRSHTKNEKIVAELRRLRKVVEDEGYVPQLNVILGQLTAKEKENMLWRHSERLALAFGLITTPPGTTIRITKNLRTCADCHSVMKIVSRVEKRQIIIRDALCVHRFLDGECSCMDQCV